MLAVTFCDSVYAVEGKEGVDLKVLEEAKLVPTYLTGLIIMSTCSISPSHPDYLY
jgi:hypothetical protein